MSGRLTWLGHNTVLIELDGVRLLTDPLLRRRVLHLRRRSPVPDELGSLDAVLVSHVHWDHLDRPSLARLGSSAPVVVPPGAGPIVRGLADVIELAPGEQAEIGELRVVATPAKHEVGRWRGTWSSSSAIGFVVNGSASIYFAGDTDLFAGMRGLAPLDAALLPVGGWGPRLPKGHLDPRGAARALQLLNPKLAVPIHWGTYAALFSHPSETAGEDFRREARQLAPEVDVRVLPVGGSTPF